MIFKISDNEYVNLDHAEQYIVLPNENGELAVVIHFPNPRATLSSVTVEGLWAAKLLAYLEKRWEGLSRSFNLEERT